MIPGLKLFAECYTARIKIFVAKEEWNKVNNAFPGRDAPIALKGHRTSKSSCSMKD